MPETRSIEDAKLFSSEGMQRVVLLESERLLVELLCLEPGQAESLHTHHDADAVYHVLEGCGRFRIGGEMATGGAGTVLLAPAGMEHAAQNAAPERLVLLAAHARQLAPGEERTSPCGG